MPSATGEAVTVSRVVVDREAVDAAAVKKVTDDAATALRVVVDKRAANTAVEVKVADDVAVAERATVEAASRDVVEPSRAPAAEAKRAAISEGSTPPIKWRFCGSWKPRYAVGHYICLFFTYAYFVLLGFFVVQCVNFQQDAYARG
jgi:hypothetical protein